MMKKARVWVYLYSTWLGEEDQVFNLILKLERSLL